MLCNIVSKLHTVDVDENDASSMHHLHWSIRLSYRTNAPAPSTSVDRGGPWLSYKPRVDPIGGVFGSYEPDMVPGGAVVF